MVSVSRVDGSAGGGRMMGPDGWNAGGSQPYMNPNMMRPPRSRHPAPRADMPSQGGVYRRMPGSSAPYSGGRYPAPRMVSLLVLFFLILTGICGEYNFGTWSITSTDLMRFYSFY